MNKIDAIIHSLNERAAPLRLRDRLTLARDAIAGRIVFTTSFGLEDQAILHVIFTAGLDIAVVTLDTGRLFAETYALWAETERHYGHRIKAYYPRGDRLEGYVETEGINGFYGSPDSRRLCCDIRKVEPLGRALEGASAWITGLRTAQSPDRSHIRCFGFDQARAIVTVNPLFDQTYEAVLSLVTSEAIPHNPLHARGFISIGCSPCTRAVRPGEAERSGRWWWETETKKECGLHLRTQNSRKEH